jgi:MFS family permease
MQSVLFSWLVVGVLDASAETVGLVQMAHMAPIMSLLLLGGTVADRNDRRPLLIRLQLVAATLGMSLAFAVSRDLLVLPILVLYALSMGSITAFVMPTRDAMLNDVSRGNLMRGATLLTLGQFGAQALGTFIAGSASFLGVGATLCIQASLMAAASLPAWFLPASIARRGTRIGLADLASGLREVARNPILRSTILMMAGVGLFLSGAYFVVMPIVVRDLYQGDVADLSLFMTLLQSGSMVGACGLLALGNIPRRGMLLAVSMFAAALPLFVLGRGVGFGAALVTAFLWGLCVAAFSSLGRAIFQEAAPPEQRARVLSIFTLSTMGAGVLGQPVSGFVAGAVGPLTTLTIAGVGLLAFVAAVTLTTQVRHID